MPFLVSRGGIALGTRPHTAHGSDFRGMAGVGPARFGGFFSGKTAISSPRGRMGRCGSQDLSLSYHSLSWSRSASCYLGRQRTGRSLPSGDRVGESLVMLMASFAHRPWPARQCGPQGSLAPSASGPGRGVRRHRTVSSLTTASMGSAPAIVHSFRARVHRPSGPSHPPSCLPPPWRAVALLGALCFASRGGYASHCVRRAFSLRHPLRRAFHLARHRGLLARHPLDPARPGT